VYSEGDGVEEDTTKQKMYHLEQALIAGHPEARYNLGMHERGKLSMERAMKHFIIAANNGHDLSMKKMVRKGYETGLCHQNRLCLCSSRTSGSLDATKSPPRDAGQLKYDQRGY
jgi:TPR repeat protein